MTREEAIKLVKRIKGAMVYTEEEKEALETLIPELAESEDERIRKWLYDYIHNCPNENFDFYGGIGKQAVLAYLEKQKPLLPEDKVKHPLYMEGFEAGKEVGRQCEKVFGKQEEQKSVENHTLEFEKAKAKYEGIVEGKQTVLDNPEDYGLCKPAEWNEEEAKKAAEDYADECPGMTHENDGSTIEDYDKPYNDFLAGVLWAKHHGIFQNGNTHWKPSEEQMEALRECGECKRCIKELYEDLQKRYGTC